MSKIKVLEKLRVSEDAAEYQWIRSDYLNQIADEIEAEITEAREIMCKKHQAERVYWHNELHKILDAIDGRERFWGDCMDYPLPEATVSPSEIAKRMLSERYMLLPVDADGVPIRVGDVLECDANGYEGTFTVFAVGNKSAIGNHEIEWIKGNPDKWFHIASYCHHVKPRTLEDVLRDCCDEYYKAYKSEYAINLADIYRKYADEIRKLGGDTE